MQDRIINAVDIDHVSIDLTGGLKAQYCADKSGAKIVDEPLETVPLALLPRSSSITSTL